MKNKDLVLIVIFIMFLFAPTILYWFLEDKMDQSNYENRNLYTKPELKLKNISEFPKSYENYFNDILPFKNEIRKKRSEILYKYFNISSNSRVIVGKDGWLFYNSSIILDGDSVSDYRKTTSYSDEHKKNIKDDLLNTKNVLSEKNIDFYVLVAPNKENVYSNYMPELINRSDKKYSKTEELIDYLDDEQDLNIIYPKNILIKNRKKFDTYYKYDTHWNNYGAYLGTLELMKQIDNKFKSPTISIEKEEKSGDLAGMNLMSSKLKNNEPLITGFYDDINYECEEKTEFKKCYSDDSLYDETILVVGDSFRNAMVQYLSKLYKNTIFIHRGYYNEDLIEIYNPDIVVYETVERYSNTLGNSNILIKEY